MRGTLIRRFVHLAAVMLLPAVADAAAITFDEAGANAAAIQAEVDAFRAFLGNPNNGNNPGPLATGRREINWDGGGATTATASGTPFAGFQNTRGALFTTPGSGFLQALITSPEFLALNPTYATGFQPFSPQRIFTAVGSNITDATFTIPGSPSTPAFVTGFGVVFSDVDLANSATLTFFDLSGNSLGTFAAPVANNGLSFIGVGFNAGERIGRVRIQSGNTAPGPADNPAMDIVMMDDFLFSEPQVAPIPEPVATMLVGAGLMLLGLVRRRR